MGMMGKWNAGPDLPSLTKQASKDETDINTILAGYAQTGVLPFAERAALGQYADVSGIGSYQECVNRVKDTERAFQALPATVRDRYGNDPAELLAAVDAAQNGDAEATAELQAIGVLMPAAAEPAAATSTTSAVPASAAEDAPAKATPTS